MMQVRTQVYISQIYKKQKKKTYVTQRVVVPRPGHKFMTPN